VAESCPREGGADDNGHAAAQRRCRRWRSTQLRVSDDGAGTAAGRQVAFHLDDLYVSTVVVSSTSYITQPILPECRCHHSRRYRFVDHATVGAEIVFRVFVNCL